MGACHFKSEFDTSCLISIKSFEKTSVLGVGSYGKVFRVHHKASGQLFAIKEYEKSSISSKEIIQSIQTEREILSLLSHPLIVNINFAFQDRKKLYLGLDLKLGGDLRFHMLQKRFKEAEIKFILACLIEGLGYLHSKKILHKDVKPENILLDENGYAFLTDFGTATVVKENNASETSGTPGYMAPEVLCRLPHGPESDFFPLGIILYENIMGCRPYIGRNRAEIRNAILEKQIKIKESDIPSHWTVHAVDFCNKLIKRKPQSRIGFKDGVNEIKTHPWMCDFHFQALYNFELKAPWIPKYFEDNQPQQSFPLPKKLKINSKVDGNAFAGYFYSPNKLF